MTNTGITEESANFKDLVQINLKLWDIEDKIRIKEANKEFDDDYDPERTSPGHISEAIPVEIIYPCENVTSHNPRCLVTQI